jgi:hypothetical protein
MRLEPSLPERNGGWLPTPEEIREQCLRLQQGWTERQRELRSCYDSPGWSVPIVSSSELSLGED